MNYYFHFLNAMMMKVGVLHEGMPPVKRALSLSLLATCLIILISVSSSINWTNLPNKTLPEREEELNACLSNDNVEKLRLVFSYLCLLHI